MNFWLIFPPHLSHTSLDGDAPEPEPPHQLHVDVNQIADATYHMRIAIVHGQSGQDR